MKKIVVFILLLLPFSLIADDAGRFLGIWRGADSSPAEVNDNYLVVTEVDTGYHIIFCHQESGRYSVFEGVVEKGIMVLSNQNGKQYDLEISYTEVFDVTFMMLRHVGTDNGIGIFIRMHG